MIFGSLFPKRSIADAGLTKKPGYQEREISPEQTVLADGSNIICAFIPDTVGTSGWIDKSDREKAGIELASAVQKNPELVKSCQGKTLAEARSILSAYIPRPDQIRKAA